MRILTSVKKTKIIFFLFLACFLSAAVTDSFYTINYDLNKTPVFINCVQSTNNNAENNYRIKHNHFAVVFKYAFLRDSSPIIDYSCYCIEYGSPIDVYLITNSKRGPPEIFLS